MLLDGYDEIAHLDKSGNAIYYIMQTILDYKVIMTSRPNALSSNTEVKFDRKIESAGLDQNGAEEYINKFFTKQKDMLLAKIDIFFKQPEGVRQNNKIKMKILKYFEKKNTILSQFEEVLKDIEPSSRAEVESASERYFGSIKTSLAETFLNNPALREVISTPINAALLCLVSSDPVSRSKLQGDLNAGTLYQEAIVWLGKRYAHKYAELNIRDLTSGGVFNIPELMVLKQVAYSEFSSGRVIIKGVAIEEKSRIINGGIRKVNEFGLLKPETAAVTQREEENDDEYDEHADDLINRDHSFIHLSFQEYLSAHMFKEKLLSNADVDVSANHDGSMMIKVAEFIGMHRNEPHYLMTLKFLAGLVTNDQSANSEILVKRFWEAVTCNVAGVIELGIDSKVTLLMHLLAQSTILEQFDSRIPNLEKIVELVDLVVASDIIKFQEDIILTGYLTSRLKETVFATINLNFEQKYLLAEEIVGRKNAYSDLAKEILAKKPIISEEAPEEAKENVATNKRLEMQSSIKIATKLITTGKLSANYFEVEIDELSTVTSATTEINSTNQLHEIFLKKLVEMLKVPNWKIKQVVINAIIELINKQGQGLKLDLQAVKDIAKIIQWHVKDENLKMETIELLTLLESKLRKEDGLIQLTILNQMAIYEGSSEKLVQLKNEYPTLPEAKLINEDTMNDIIDSYLKHSSWIQRYIGLNLIKNLAEKQPDLLNEIVVVELIECLCDSSPDVKVGVVEAIGAVALSKPELVDISKLIDRLSESDDYTREAIANAIGEVVSKRPELINMAELVSKLDDIDWRIRDGVIQTIELIALNKPELINKEALMRLIEKLSDSNESLVANAIGVVALNKPELITKKTVEKLIESLIRHSTHIPGCCGENVDNVAKAIGEIASKRPELIDMAELVQKLADSDTVTREGAVRAIVEIASKRSELVSMTELVSKLKHSDSDIRKTVAKAIVTIASVKPELINEDIFTATNQLSNGSELIIELVIKLISLTASSKPERINENIMVWLGQLTNADSINKAIIADAIGSIVNIKPELVNDSFIAWLNGQLSNSDHTIAIIATKARISIASVKLELADESVMIWLINQLSNNNFDIGMSASKAIKSIAFVKPELINDSFVFYLMSQLSHSDSKTKIRIIDIISSTISMKLELKNILALSDNLIDSNCDISKVVAIALESVALSKPALISKDVITTLIESFGNSNSDIREMAVSAIKSVVTFKPELINIEELISQLSNDNSYVRRSFTEVAGSISSAKPELISKTVFTALVEKLGDIDSYVRESAVETIGSIASVKPELINMEEFISQLNNDNYYIKKSFAQLIGSIAFVRPELISEAIFVSLVRYLSDNDITGTIAKVIGSIASIKPELIKEDAVSWLSNQLSNSDYDVRGVAARAIISIVSVKPELINENIVGWLINKLSDVYTDINTRASAAKALGPILFVRPELINTVGLIEKLSDSSSNIRASAARIIESITSIKPELITDGVVVELTKKLSDSDFNVRKSVIEAIGCISLNKPELITENIVTQLIVKLGDIDSDVRASVVETIGSIASVKLELINKDILLELIIKLSDSDISGKIIEAIKIITDVKPELVTTKILADLSSRLSVAEEGREISKIVSAFALSLSENAIRLLDSSVPEARALVKQVFMMVLSNQEEQTKAKVNSLLSIIAFHDPKDKEKKILIEVAKKALDSKLNYLEKDEDIAKITEGYEDLLRLSSEGPVFLRKLYTKVLSDSKITAIEKDFIIKSIQNGIATSFTKQGQIVFEGMTYTLQDEESKSYLKEIIQAALEQKNDLLVKQYNEYKPIFVNNETGMRRAANDIDQVVSVVDQAKLDHTHWHLSLMHYANQAETISLDQSRIFMILERRNEFGDIIIAKIAHTHKEVYAIYPTELNKYRTEIFDVMEYSSTKPRYYSTEIQLTYEQGVKLLSSTGATDSASSGNNYQFVRSVLSGILSPLAMAKLGLSLEWNQYIYHPSTIESTKDMLFKSDYHQARRESFAVDTRLALNSLSQRYEDNKKLVDARFNGLSAELNAMQAEIVPLIELKKQFKSDIDALTSKISAINIEGGNTFSEDLRRKLENIDRLNEDIEYLKSNQDSSKFAEMSQRLELQQQEMMRLTTDIERHKQEIGRITVLSTEIEKLKENEVENAEKIATLSAQVTLLMKLSEEMTRTKMELAQLNERMSNHDVRLTKIAQNSDDYAGTVKRLELIFAESTTKKEDVLALQRRLEQQETTLAALLKSDKDNESKIQDLRQEIALNQDKMTEIDAKIAEHTEKLTQLEPFLRDATILESMIAKEKLSESAMEELQAIFSDPYKEAFYNGLKWQLSATYLAATVVQTDIVANSKTGALSTVGNVVTTLAPHVPFIGFGVQLLGNLLTKVDAVMQSRMVANYAHIVSGSEEMAKLVDIIARQIVISNLDIKEDTGLLAKLFNFAKQTIGGVDAIVSSGTFDTSATGLQSAMEGLAIDQALSNVEEKIDDTISQKRDGSFFGGMGSRMKGAYTYAKSAVTSQSTLKDKPKEKTAAEKAAEVELQQQAAEEAKITTAKQKGENDAAIVAQVIITNIYAGNTEDSIVEDKAAFLIKFVQGQYKYLEIAGSVINTGNAASAIDVNHDTSYKISGVAAPVAKAIVVDKEHRSKEIADAVLDRAKVLLKAKALASADSDLESEFVDELAIALLTSYRSLLEVTEKSNALKTGLIKNLADQFTRSGKLCVVDGKFAIQEELRYECDAFLNPVIDSAKEMLKQKDYYDEVSNTKLVIMYVNNIHYDSDNLLLYQDELVYEVGQIGGLEAIDELIELGEDIEVARAVIDATKRYGVNHVANVMFTSRTAEIIKLLEVKSASVSDKFDYQLVVREQTDKQNPAIFESLETSLFNQETLFVSTAPISSSTAASILQEFSNCFTSRLNLDLSWLCKTMIYRQDIIKFNEILQTNGIDRSVDVLKDYSDFRKSVLLTLHPDKGGNSNDFVFVNDLQKKFSTNLDINKLLTEQMQVIQPVIYKAGLCFKTLDNIVDAARLMHEPTIDHTKKLALDFAYLYGMYSGVNEYSAIITGADVLYQAYQGLYEQAIKQALVSAGYMTVPTMIAYAGIPYIGFAYGAGMTLYTGYSAITNAYSFYQEYGSIGFELRSATAYKDITQALLNSPFQQVYDFTSAMQEYVVKVNNINLSLEKEAIKSQLEMQGEFGQKLYNYIYAPALEEKYDLLSKILQGILTEEQAEAYIKITLEEQIYEHCMEIKSIESNGNQEEFNKEYYCYNEDQQILDHIMIGENREVEVIARL